MSKRVLIEGTQRGVARQHVDYGMYDPYGRRCGIQVCRYTVDSRLATAEDLRHWNMNDIADTDGPTVYYAICHVTREGKLYGGSPSGAWFSTEEKRDEWVTKRIEQSMRRVADNEMYQDSLTGQVNTAKGWRKQGLNVAEGDRFTPVVENNRKRPGFNPAHGAYRPAR